MKNINVRLLPAALALTLGTLCAALPAHAQGVPANNLRIGIYAVFYHTNADDISGAYVPPGVNLNVKDVQTIYFAYVRRLSAHFDMELAAGSPPVTHTVGKGPATLGSVPYNGAEISTARWFAPTLLVEYRFLGEHSPLQPFIGVGVNYTSFYDRNSTAAGDAANGGPTKLSLSASIGPAATAGVSYAITSRWNLHASYSWSRVDSKLTADTAGVIRTTHIRFGPQALVLSVGYSF